MNWWCARWMRPIKIHKKLNLSFQGMVWIYLQGVCIGLVGNPRKKKCICHFENAQFSELWNCGNWIAGPGSSQLGMRSTIAITFTRLFLLPPIGIAVVLTADRLGFLPPDDKMFRFVLLLQQSMPTSILAGTYILPHKVLVGIRVVWLNPEVHCRLPTACFQGNGIRQRINKCCVVIWTYKEPSVPAESKNHGSWFFSKP